MNIENLSGTVDRPDVFHTYYLRIATADGVFHKFGYCKGTVAHRYRKEPKGASITVLALWPHASEAAALRHEEKLVKTYPGLRPYIGQCGPLIHGGNTEVYCHDVMGQEPPPPSYIVRMVSCRYDAIYSHGYPARNPRASFRHLEGTVRYMDYAFGPKEVPNEGSYLQVPLASHEESVTLATEGYIDAVLDGSRLARPGVSKKALADARERYIPVSSWDDYASMEFEGRPFSKPRFDEWF